MDNHQASPVFKILVIGANGGIGRQAVELALKAGHHVTAMVRDPAKLPLTHPNLEIVKGDIMHPETFEKYVGDQDAVISAIGSGELSLKGDKPTVLYSQGNANLIQVMKKKNIGRAFFISASAVEISPVLPFYVRLVEKYIIQKLLRHMYADQLIMETLIKDTSFNWTIIRPPQLNDKPVTGRYRIALNSFLKNCLKISRADVAHFMINNIFNEMTYKTTIEIGY